MIIELQPVGQVDTTVLERIRTELKRFGDVRVNGTKPVPKRAYRLLAKGYRAAAFGAVCATGKSDRVLAITDVQLCDPDLGMNRVFGHADIAGRWAVVSMASFRDDGQEKLVERTVKTAVHEIGHTLGLGHDDANPDCVMHFSENLADTDRKGRDFCPACEKSAELTLSRI